MSRAEQLSSAYHWLAELLIALSECRPVWSITTHQRILELEYSHVHP